MTAARAADLLRQVGLLADGPVPWGRPVRSTRAGVFLVELPAPTEHAPLDLALVGKWLERATDLLLDGARPTSKSLLARVARDWLPDQAVILLGSTGASLADHVAAIRATAPGEPLPCPDGLRLHLLRGVERCTIWWADTEAPEEYEDALLDAFAAGVEQVAGGGRGSFVAPFGVLRRPTGEERPTGITGALAALPTAAVAPPARVVELPAATASRQLGAPAPRAVARDGSPGTSRSARTGPSRGRQAPRPDPSEQPGSSSGAGGRQPAEETLQLSPEGLERLQAELHELRTIRRPEVVRRVATAREHGDLKENAEYHAAREELGFLDGRANAIAARLRSAVVVDVPDPGARAGIGSTLVVVCDGEEQTLRLVGSSEADVATGRISVVSPVGRALMGASEGDEVAVATPAGQVAYRVLSIT